MACAEAEELRQIFDTFQRSREFSKKREVSLRRLLSPPISFMKQHNLNGDRP